jgi:arylsulfatase A-like enzyme
MPRPNILFIMTDDHAAHALSCYGSRINKTPNLDRIANEGMRFNNCFCTNSLCEPSRRHPHRHLQPRQRCHHHRRPHRQSPGKRRQGTAAQRLPDRRHWQVAFGPGVGAHWPTGFDEWNILQGQGPYFDPEMVRNGEKLQYTGYTTDIITDLSLDWLKQRDEDKPFFLMCQYKAPHRPWDPDDKHADLYEDIDIPVPETFDDDYAGRAAAGEAKMTVAEHLTDRDLKQPVPEGLTPAEEKHWKYQRYIKDYLRCVASVDDNVGRVLDYLAEEGLSENTLVIYTSDQGFFLGDHGWYDKRFMYEESLRMPFIVRYPKTIAPGSVNDDIINNVDFAATWLDLVGIEAPERFQGRSFLPLLQGNTPEDWQQSLYYRYWMHLAHHLLPPTTACAPSATS